MEVEEEVDVVEETVETTVKDRAGDAYIPGPGPGGEDAIVEDLKKRSGLSAKPMAASLSKSVSMSGFGTMSLPVVACIIAGVSLSAALAIVIATRVSVFDMLLENDYVISLF